MKFRSRNENGATVVETALVASIVFFFIFAVFQSALFGRTYLAAGNAAADGARAGSIAGNDAPADYDVLQSVKRSLTSVNSNQIESIVVFRAQAPDFKIPDSCLTAAGPDCNRYVAEDLDQPITQFVPGGWTKDDDWMASERFLSGDDSRLGVYVELNSGAIGWPFPETIKRASSSRPESG